MENLSPEALSTSAHYAKKKVQKALVESIPFDFVRSLPARYAISVGVLIMTMQLITFGYFTGSGYTSDQKAFFVSFSSNAGVCEEVPKAASQVISASSTGYWEGESGFSYLKSNLQFTFNNYLSDTAQYSEMMYSTVKAGYIDKEGLKSKNRTMAENLVVELVGEYHWINNDHLQVFSFGGEPSMAMDIDHEFPGFVGASDVCTGDYVPSLAYHPSTSTVEFTWSVDGFLTSGCSSFVNWTWIGYPVDTFKPPSSFSSSIDMEAFFTAVAINLGVLPFSYLILTSRDESFIHHGVNYTANYYIHPSFLGMKEVFCVSPWLANSSAPTVCAVSNLKSMGGEWMFGIPIVSAVSQDCFNCTAESRVNPDCDKLYLSMGVVVLPSGHDDFGQFVEVIGAYSSYFEYNRAMAPHMYHNYLTNNDGMLEYMCNGIEDCFMLSWYAMNVDGVVNGFRYQFEQSHCKDPFSSPGFSRMAAVPFVPLVENYYKCVNTKFVSFFNAMGVASGNAGIIVPIVAFLLLPLIYWNLRLIGVHSEQSEFDEEDISEALKDFARDILRRRRSGEEGLARDKGDGDGDGEGEGKGKGKGKVDCNDQGEGKKYKVIGNNEPDVSEIEGNRDGQGYTTVDQIYDCSGSSGSSGVFTTEVSPPDDASSWWTRLSCGN